MKVMFLLDSNEYVVLEPEMLQLRQIGKDQTALGYEVRVPVKNEADPAAEPQLQTGFRPLINYTINLSVPKVKKAKAAKK